MSDIECSLQTMISPLSDWNSVELTFSSCYLSPPCVLPLSSTMLFFPTAVISFPQLAAKRQLSGIFRFRSLLDCRIILNWQKWCKTETRFHSPRFLTWERSWFIFFYSPSVWHNWFTGIIQYVPNKENNNNYHSTSRMKASAEHMRPIVAWMQCIFEKTACWTADSAQMSRLQTLSTIFIGQVSHFHVCPQTLFALKNVGEGRRSERLHAMPISKEVHMCNRGDSSRGRKLRSSLRRHHHYHHLSISSVNMIGAILKFSMLQIWCHTICTLWKLWRAKLGEHHFWFLLCLRHPAACMQTPNTVA